MVEQFRLARKSIGTESYESECQRVEGVLGSFRGDIYYVVLRSREKTYILVSD